MILYSISFLFLTLALAGFGLIKEKSREYSIFLIDVSDSISIQAQSDATSFINHRLKNMDVDDYAGIVLFGESGMIEKNLQNNLRHVTFESQISGRSTNIEEAMYKAIGMFPDKGKRSIFIFSDGLENSGNSRTAAVRAASAGIKIFSIPLYSEKPDSEVYIQDLIVPEKINKEQIHDYTLIIGSTIQTTSRVTFFKDGVYMGEENLFLYSGLNTFTYSSKIEESGIHEYRAMIEPESDTYRENNVMTVPVTVSGEPKVMIVSESNSPYLKEALSVQNIQYEVISPMMIPRTSGMLLEYDSIIFDNIPSGSVSIAQMNMIKDFVKNKGGGFLMVGGDKSFGAGGYYDTPLEEILPVDMDVTSSLQIPSLTMVMVIDRSGSMKTAVERGINKLDVAKEAILEAVEILNPFYKVGIIAFDTDFHFAVPLIEASELDTIKDQLMAVKATGGTDLYPAMKGAFESLKASDSAVRHMIILSDGLSDDGEFKKLSKDIAAEGITVSTVAVGTDSDKEMMENIASWGEGRSYFTADIREVPRIFASESFIVSRAHIVEETFLPNFSTNHDITRDIEDFFPALDGFVLTYPKSGATHILKTTDDHPLLSIWKYGLGRTASWSSDFSGRWGSRLTSWDKFPQLAAQIVRWIERPIHPQQLSFNFTGSGRKRVLSINAKDENNEYINKLELEGILSSADGTEQNIKIEQKGPGIYTTEFELNSEGTSIITIFDKNNGIDPEITGISLPYSSEFRPMNEDFTLLIELAETTGGSIINLENHDFSDYDLQENPGTKEMKEILALIALIVFLINIILRLIPEKRLTSGSLESESQDFDELRLKIDRSKKENMYKNKKDNFWFG